MRYSKRVNCTAANNGHNGFPERDKDDRERDKEEKLLRATGQEALFRQDCQRRRWSSLGRPKAHGEGLHTPSGVAVSVPAELVNQSAALCSPAARCLFARPRMPVFIKPLPVRSQAAICTKDAGTQGVRYRDLPEERLMARVFRGIMH